jgi:hypothetical protein
MNGHLKNFKILLTGNRIIKKVIDIIEFVGQLRYNKKR